MRTVTSSSSISAARAAPDSSAGSPIRASCSRTVPFARLRRGARCAERIGPNLRHYTTAVAVDDFDQVRAALGYDKINIYGGSYGVTSGQVYLSRHGSHVRGAVFDSGSLLDVHIFERGASNAQRALDLLFTRCAADSACHSAYPDLRRQYERTVALSRMRRS